MASEKPEDPMNNTAGTDEETVAQRRKRLRRVSFADREITSVHIFNRDEDYETPPNSSASKPQNGEQADSSGSEDKVIRFFGELADMEATEGDGDAEEDVVHEKSFLRPKSSPSSGGSTIGSATSDDEDNFFGPVSSHFINPGRLSDTTISEEHHDITMDSTAFSMHFRSLAMSESGDVKTPMSSHLPVEGETPTQFSFRSATGSEMALTEPKRLFSKSPRPVDNCSSGGGDSNDMSIVGENSRKYDYGHISPTLAALLGDESKELLPASGDNIVNERSPIHDIPLSPQIERIPVSHAYKDTHGADSNDASQMLSPNGSCYHRQIVLQESGSQRYTKEASISSSTIRRQSASLVGILPQPLSCFTPSPKQSGGFLTRETRALVGSLSTIQKSQSRLGLIPPSPASALSQRIEKSKLQLSKSRLMTTPSAIGREEVSVHREKHEDIPITNLEDLLSQHGNRTPVSGKKGTPDQHGCGALSPAVDINNVFACTSPEGNTNSKVEGSVLKQQQRNQKVSTPEKFVSSLASSPYVTSALKNFVTLHNQEQQSKAPRNSETGGGTMNKGCASNDSLNTLSENVNSLLEESGVLLTDSGFLNGSAQPKEKDIINKNDVKVHSETEVIPTDDLPAVVTENVPATSGSSFMNRIKNEASHAKGESSLKRKAKDVDLVFRSCSPKVGKSTLYISNRVMDHPGGNYDANDCRIVRKEVMNWIEIPGRVAKEINHMLAPLAEKLNSRLLWKLEDVLTHLKKDHLCEMLCLQIQSQKVREDLTAAKAKRRAESRKLLCKLAYEKAKFELLHLKKQIMMTKYQAVTTGIQTSEILRLNFGKLLRQHSIPSVGLLNPEQAHEVTNKGAELTEELKVLDSKIRNLIKSFRTCDKMIGEPSYADTITIAEDNLEKKMRCRFIRQDILVWKVESLGERNDCQSIILNYRGLINQRLTLKPNHASCVLISNSSSDKFIKNFPDMNISVGVNFLFSTDYSQKYVCGLLLETTQKTSLLLCNLLDVAEELQIARMEMPNLVHGSFDSRSGEQLHLRISFIDCKNMRKLTMILDVTCLSHGNYPGDIIPCELLEISGTKRGGVVAKQLTDEIESAMVNVGVGYPRILRLCRCISNILRSQKGDVAFNT